MYGNHYYIYFINERFEAQRKYTWHSILDQSGFKARAISHYSIFHYVSRRLRLQGLASLKTQSRNLGLNQATKSAGRNAENYIQLKEGREEGRKREKKMVKRKHKISIYDN